MITLRARPACPVFAGLLYLLAFPAIAPAQFTYSTNNGVVEISSYVGNYTVVEIPAMTNGYPVTSIGANAFIWKDRVVSVVIPDGVTNIGDSAFAYCASLTSVNIPEGVLRLGNSIFNKCTSLPGIFIPQSVTNIGSTPFIDCPNLSAINVAADNLVFASDQGVLVNKSLTTLIECPGGKAGDYIVPAGVTNLTACAFFSCQRLISITLPESVLDLGNATFNNCSSLTNMVIPNKVTRVPHSSFSTCTNLLSVSLGTNIATLEQDSFANCTRLASVTFPNSVQSIGWGAFGYCTNLSDAHFGTNITLIGTSAFGTCYNLTNVWLPDSLQTIQSSAFGSCYSLSAVHFGRNLSQLAGDAFKECHQLTSYDVNPQSTNFHSLDGVLFNLDLTTLLRCPLGLSGSYQVPDGVTEIGSEAFYDCTRLTRIILPESLKRIRNYAFQNCTNLVSLAIPASVTNLQGTAFAWCGESLKSVYFAGSAPSGMDDSDFYGDSKTTVYYLPGTSDWSSIFCGRPAVLWNPQPLTSDPSFGIQASGFGFKINGSENIPLLVEACTNLSGSVWTPVHTNVLTGGTIDFRDGEWTSYPGRFYRIRWP